jgi:hypothetical protein
MKKMLIVMMVVAMAVAACGKKQAPAQPKTDTTAPAAGSAGSGDATKAPTEEGKTPAPSM